MSSQMKHYTTEVGGRSRTHINIRAPQRRNYHYQRAVGSSDSASELLHKSRQRVIDNVVINHVTLKSLLLAKKTLTVAHKSSYPTSEKKVQVPFLRGKAEVKYRSRQHDCLTLHLSYRRVVSPLVYYSRTLLYGNGKP